ncbi:MlaD family protein [Flavicella sediminum]|uniref:MlaD family protein n=1 Tax=Flavicella sediminum TaxID=2585141 RepID=UPI00111D6DC3|nr:MlaD family protein [Flavicella sediminum]
MIKFSRELKTGIVAIVIIAIFLWGYSFLKGHNLFEGPSHSYFTEYNNVQGLNTASVVTINGYQVGKVVDIKFNEKIEKRGQLVVEFTVENDFHFDKNSVAKIYSASLMGGKSLAIIPSYDDPVLAKPGDFLRGEIESDMFSSFGEKLNPLQAKLESVIVSADSLLVHVNSVFDEESKNNIRGIISKMNSTMANLDEMTATTELIVLENRKNIHASVDNTEKITNNFAKLSDTLVNANIGQLIAKIEATVENLQTVSEGMAKGEGTIGKLMKDDAVYDNLDNASKELEELLRDLKLHPKRYVHFSLFGKKEKEYQKN